MIKLRDIIESIENETVPPITKEEERKALQKIIKWLVPNAVEFHNRVVKYTLTNTIPNLKRKLGMTTEYEMRKHLKKVDHEPNKISYLSKTSDGSVFWFYVTRSSDNDTYPGRLVIRLSPSFGGRPPGGEITMGFYV